MNTDSILYFGYGSLVNRDTRPVQEIAHSARLRGWQRVWDHSVVDPNRDKQCTSLSIEPCPDRPSPSIPGHMQPGIEGVVVSLPVELLPQLDEREFGYDRLGLPVSDFDLPDELAEQLSREGAPEVIMAYRSQPQNRILANVQSPVLQSYIDCVMAGYLHRFGEEGVEAMVASTRGWDCSIFNDRDNPFYPRWVNVSPANQDYFDECIDGHLNQLGHRRLA